MQGPLRPPVGVRTVDLTGPAADVDLRRSGTPFASALLVGTAHGRPVATLAVDLAGRDVLPAAEARAALLAVAGAEAAAAPAPAPVGREPRISVVLTTCAQPEPTVRTVRSLLACRPAPVEVVVVDNRPAGSTVAATLREQFGDDDRVRYVEEPRRGLSWARNAGLAAVRSDLVAFTDDDVVADPGWLGALTRAFDEVPGAACVTGLILPSDLETPAQVVLEQYAGFGKGFARRVHRLDRPTSPLFPYAAGEFGSGANTAMRTAVLRALGGFDRSLGAGTPARGGEDLDLYIRVLLAGHELVYEPGAIVWHRHVDDEATVRHKVFSYGIGLSAVLTKLATHGHARRIARRATTGVRFVLSPTSRKNERKDDDYPRALDRLELLGMAAGPVAYAASRRRARSAA